jgi:hypothetical protein
MSLGKLFRPRKTRKARKYSGIYQIVGCHIKYELLNQHTHTDLFRVFRESIEV